MQTGGRIVGEGIDGCVFAEPAWPCEGTKDYQHIPLSRDGRYVSKIVPMSDTEDEYLRAAEHLLGPLASTFIAKLEGSCAPANSKNPPKLADKGAFMASQSSLAAWTEKDQACESLKQTLKEGKTISEAIQIMDKLKKENHIDGDLFEIFLTSGIYSEYAEKFLQPYQRDSIDISKYVS